MFHGCKAWEQLRKGYYLPEVGRNVTSFYDMHLSQSGPAARWQPGTSHPDTGHFAATTTLAKSITRENDYRKSRMARQRRIPIKFGQ
jgi:hypothetical protein